MLTSGFAIGIIRVLSWWGRYALWPSLPRPTPSLFLFLLKESRDKVHTKECEKVHERYAAQHQDWFVLLDGKFCILPPEYNARCQHETQHAQVVGQFEPLPPRLCVILPSFVRRGSGLGEDEEQGRASCSGQDLERQSFHDHQRGHAPPSRESLALVVELYLRIVEIEHPNCSLDLANSAPSDFFGGRWFVYQKITKMDGH